LLLWDGRPARPFWTGGTPIPQTCGSYLILIPYINIQLTLRAGNETEKLIIHGVDRSLANKIALILNRSIPFPPLPQSRTFPPVPQRKKYDIYDDDAWLVSSLSFYPNSQTVKISAGHQLRWGVSLDFERTVRLQDIADIRGEIDSSAHGYSYRFAVILQSGERLILMEDGYGGLGATLVGGEYIYPIEQEQANLENKVNAEVAEMRKFLHECSCFDVK